MFCMYDAPLADCRPHPSVLFRAYLGSTVPSCRGVNKMQMTLDNETDVDEAVICMNELSQRYYYASQVNRIRSS
jgi:Zn ribbon nucleic-acid-binding protein